MKKLPYTICLIITVLILSCSHRDQSPVDQSKPDQLYTHQEDSISTDSQNDSSHIFTEIIEENLDKYRDTLVGKFNGRTIDTLICEPIDSLVRDEDFGDLHYEWRIYTKKHTVKDLILNGTIGIKFIKEGDLDGNGTEEWSFINQWYSSTWTSFSIFTYKNGEWDYLVHPSTINYNHLDWSKEHGWHGEEIARPAKKRGFIHLKFTNVRDDGAEWVLVDTLIRVNK